MISMLATLFSNVDLLNLGMVGRYLDFVVLWRPVKIERRTIRKLGKASRGSVPP
jgi:hypothetical protein